MSFSHLQSEVNKRLYFGEFGLKLCSMFEEILHSKLECLIQTRITARGCDCHVKLFL